MGFTSIPVSGNTIDSGPPQRVAITGKPAVIASTSATPKVSTSLDNTST
ncbi:uncharacterized protein METZ01_LOCUS117663 [marine metagenome]|uniref:Uncharacterized protein n=1 Tax=marine metagenome TaxID=408172 RepID=A0A381XJD5_9ZZZZ